MISTLFKYEIRGTRNLTGLTFAVCTLITGVGALLAVIGWPVIGQLGTGLAFLGPIGLLYAVQIGLVIWYYRSSYGRSGYLTQSIPVKGSTIFWVKLVYAGLVSVGALLWSCVLAFVAWLGTATGNGRSALEPFEALGRVWPQIGAMVPAWMWLALVVFTLFSQLTAFAPYFFAVSVGSEARFARLGLGGPVLVWFIAYTVIQLIVMAAFFLPVGIGLVDGRLGFTVSNFVGDLARGVEPQSMPFGYLPVMIAVMIGLMWRTAVSWNKRVSLN